MKIVRDLAAHLQRAVPDQLLSRSLTLVPGTVLLTGTPAGCGFAQKPPRWMQPGDVYEVEIKGVGTLRNRYTAAD